MDIRPAAPGRIDLAVQAVPLAEALQCLSQRTGMKVVYDGLSAPRQLVSASIKGATMAEVVEKLFEAQGLNYALGLDKNGQRGGLLVVSRSSAASASAPSGSAARPTASRGPEPALEHPSESEGTPEPPVAEEPPAEPAPAQPGLARPALPGLMGVPGTSPQLGWQDPRFRPLYPEPAGLTPTTQP